MPLQLQIHVVACPPFWCHDIFRWCPKVNDSNENWNQNRSSLLFHRFLTFCMDSLQRGLFQSKSVMDKMIIYSLQHYTILVLTYILS